MRIVGDPIIIIPILLVLIAARIFAAYLVARYAKGKGYSFWLFFILGALFSVLLCWLVAALLPSKVGKVEQN